MRRSTTDIAWFWNSVLLDLDIQFTNRTRDCRSDERQTVAKWCVDGEMNIVTNCSINTPTRPTDKQPAINPKRRRTSVRLLTKIAHQSRSHGDFSSHLASASDAIGVFMPMVPEIVVAMLAIIKIGGIFSALLRSAQRQLCRD